MSEQELAPELQPEEGREAPKAEDMPSSDGRSNEDRKAIYKRARKDRELVTGRDAEENPGIEAVQQMIAEAQDDDERENTSSQLLDPDEVNARFNLEAAQEEAAEGVEETEEEADEPDQAAAEPPETVEEIIETGPEPRRS